MLRPCVRQVPKIDARVILVSVPCWDRVPPLIFRLVTRCRRLRSAVRLGRIVWGHLRLGHKDEQLLYVVLHAPAQRGLGSRWVGQIGVAEGQQAMFQGQLSGAALPC